MAALIALEPTMGFPERDKYKRVYDTNGILSAFEAGAQRGLSAYESTLMLRILAHSPFLESLRAQQLALSIKTTAFLDRALEEMQSEALRIIAAQRAGSNIGAMNVADFSNSVASAPPDVNVKKVFSLAELEEKIKGVQFGIQIAGYEVIPFHRGTYIVKTAAIAGVRSIFSDETIFLFPGYSTDVLEVEGIPRGLYAVPLGGGDAELVAAHPFLAEMKNPTQGFKANVIYVFTDQVKAGVSKNY